MKKIINSMKAGKSNKKEQKLTESIMSVGQS